MSESENAAKLSRECVVELQPESIVTESKFLRLESLHELVKALILESRPAEAHESMGTQYSEDSAVFYLEMLFRIVVQNRDRILTFWNSVKQHLIDIISTTAVYSILLERAVTGLLRLGIRLLHREDLQTPVLHSLQILLLISPKVMPRLYRQISYGIDEIIQKCGADIHTKEDWETIFLLLKTAGAGLILEKTVSDEANVQSETAENDGDNISIATSESGISDTESECGNASDRGYTTDDNETHQTEIINMETPESLNQFTLTYHVEVGPHDQKALIRSADSLAFLVRDTAHVTPANFEICVDAIRAFVEASMNGVNKITTSTKKKSRRSKSTKEEPDTSESNTEEYHKVSMQLLELMHTLHTRAGKIFRSWEEENAANAFELSNLWETGWCPLLQGIARLCCDARRGVRTTAFNFLSSSLLVQDLQVLSGSQWEACFHKVLFPLLNRLLDNISPHDPNSMDETRMRAASLLSKVFLQHLKDLLTSPTFTACWLTILDFMDKYMRVGNRDLLCEAIPESLKNMLLVMDTAGIFHTAEAGYTDLWEVTWERIDIFLPNLKQELFRETQQPQHLMPPAVAQLPQNERMGQPVSLPPSVTTASTGILNKALNMPPVNVEKVGVTVGISSNPLYTQSDLIPEVPESVTPKIATTVMTSITQVEPEYQAPVDEQQGLNLITPSAGSLTPTLINTPPLSATPPPLNASVSVGSPSIMSNSAPGLLFDPSIIGSVPVVTPVVSPSSLPVPSTETGSTSKPLGLTRSDSLAAVIADLNQTLAKSSVTNEVGPSFQAASALFQGEGCEDVSAFDQISK